jgi:hypothetical protein
VFLHFWNIRIVQDAPSVASLVNPYCDGYLFKHGVTYGCWPTWKRRYCIVKGGFLFKFSSPNSSKPKGTPIPLTDCEIDGVDLPAAAAAAAKKADPSANVQHTLYGVRLSTLIHEYTFGCVSEEERSHWIRKLRTHKQLAIKQMMGHAPVSADEQFAAKVHFVVHAFQIRFGNISFDFCLAERLELGSEENHSCSSESGRGHGSAFERVTDANFHAHVIMEVCVALILLYITFSPAFEKVYFRQDYYKANFD